VIDFVDFYSGDWHFPAFNLADSAITIGAIMLIIDALWLQSDAADRTNG
ncbi:MAG: signal peptidase II, partial [Gammaproteobacteria bacterium]